MIFNLSLIIEFSKNDFIIYLENNFLKLFSIYNYIINKNYNLINLQFIIL